MKTGTIGTTSTYAERGVDFYPTPLEGVLGLLAAEGMRIPAKVWEPACGDGAIVRPLRATGREVIASDLYDYGLEGADVGVDFLSVEGTTSFAIVTNPPFRVGLDFARQAIAISPYVALFFRLAFLESETRLPFFRRSPPSVVHVFSCRLPMMHRQGYEGAKIEKAALPFAWFVWDRARPFEGRLSWIGPEDIEAARVLVGGGA